MANNLIRESEPSYIPACPWSSPLVVDCCSGTDSLSLLGLYTSRHASRWAALLVCTNRGSSLGKCYSATTCCVLPTGSSQKCDSTLACSVQTRSVDLGPRLMGPSFPLDLRSIHGFRGFCRICRILHDKRLSTPMHLFSFPTSNIETDASNKDVLISGSNYRPPRFIGRLRSWGELDNPTHPTPKTAK